MAKPGPKPRAGAATKLVPIRLTEDEHARWRSAADREVLTLSEFVRSVVERAIRTG